MSELVKGKSVEMIECRKCKVVFFNDGPEPLKRCKKGHSLVGTNGVATVMSAKNGVVVFNAIDNGRSKRFAQ
jgi:hypothetical protein